MRINQIIAVAGVSILLVLILVLVFLSAPNQSKYENHASGYSKYENSKYDNSQNSKYEDTENSKYENSKYETQPVEEKKWDRQEKPSSGGSEEMSCGLLKMYILNVSQADAIFIITPQNKTILIDSGSSIKPHSSMNVVAFLKQLHISKIDYLIASHYHEDHIGGMKSIFENFEVGTIYDNGNCGNYSSEAQRIFESYFSSHPHVVVSHDMEFNIDPCISAQLFAPYDRPEGCWPSNIVDANENENSVVLHIVYGNTSFLFAGDCESGCEQIIAQKPGIRSDFAKVDHHGSATSSTPQFLTAVGARFYAVSTDKERSVIDGYYHPRKTALSNIYTEGARDVEHLFRTDLNGDITVISDGKQISITAQNIVDECQLFSGYSIAKASSYGPILELAHVCG